MFFCQSLFLRTAHQVSVEIDKWHFNNNAENESQHVGHHQYKKIVHHHVHLGEIQWCLIDKVYFDEVVVDDVGHKRQSSQRHETLPRKDSVCKS